MNPRLSAKQINRLLQAFASATVLFVLTSLVYATWQYLHQGYDAFSYKKAGGFYHHTSIIYRNVHRYDHRSAVAGYVSTYS